jgi:type VI secretion system (T6SS) immunity protein Tdi1
MFGRFIASFQVEPPGQRAGAPWADDRLLGIAGYRELAGRSAGCSLENGLYRIHDAVTGPQAASQIDDAFPRFASRACPFGYDWLGRQFAADSGRREGGEPLVLFLEPGTGEALEIPFTFAAFHEELDALREPALASNFFANWAEANPQCVPLSATQCAGYKIPLFLGGQDTVENLEVIDIDVYWSLSGQLRSGARVLPPGMSIGRVDRA